MTNSIIVTINLQGPVDKGSVLRAPASQVEFFDDDLRELLRKLDEVMRASKIAVGLAAPQIGQGLRVAAVNVDRSQPTLFLINPVVLSTSGKKDVKYESCMSIPFRKGRVERRHKVSVKYSDAEGREQRLDASGFLARVIQHEIDHLNGVLYVDHVSGGASSLEQADFFSQDETQLD